MQYHLERDGTKTTVDLGKFDKEKHLKWIEAHPHKKPKLLAQGKQLSHFYSDGSICDKTGKLRQTEVEKNSLFLYIYNLNTFSFLIILFLIIKSLFFYSR